MTPLIPMVLMLVVKTQETALQTITARDRITIITARDGVTLITARN